MNLTVNKGVAQHREQNVHFTDQTADWIYSVPSEPDATFHVADNGDATLEEFFSRPVRLASYEWKPGTAFFQTLDPWTTFFHNLRVVNRINNYNILRAKLNVKILLNGNGFYYGRMLVAYLPRPNEIFGSPLPRAGVYADMVQMSQCPHVYLDPTTSQGGDFQLPFFCPNNGLSIPGDDFAQMGILNMMDIVNLWHANNGTTSVTISVFAWATDVQLSIPTSTRNGAVLPQMGDEYGQGPISRPASTIARAAGRLAVIPSIAPYAKATQVAAGAVGTIANIFGYSRPSQEKPSETIKPEYLGTIANTNTPDNTTKLTLDCKQEVTVDPRVTGLGSADEMTILSLAQRESLLTTFEWSAAAAPDDLLFNKYVTPMSYFNFATGSDVEHRLTPAAFAALPFAYWRGTMRFRFQIVASAFHKGRIKIVYDPYLLQTASLDEYNINYSHIADLGEDRDFTLDFGWAHNQTWLPVLDLQTADLYSPSGSTSILTVPGPTVGANGLFAVVVVNNLTATTDVVPSVKVNVFVSAGDDFEVCVPSCQHLSSLSYSPGIAGGGSPGGRIMQAQMGEVADPVDTATESAPIQEDSVDIMASKLPVDHTLDVFFGDPVVSFRQCLKRYEYSRCWMPNISSMEIQPNNTNAYMMWQLRLPDVPIYHGAPSGAIDDVYDSLGADAKWNYAKFTLLNYLLPAYAARRGGLRWKYHLIGHANDPSTMSITLGRAALGYNSYAQGIYQWGALATSTLKAVNALMPHTWCATHVTDVRNNPVIEAEIPYYEPRRFIFTRDLNVTDAGRFSTSYHYLTAIFPVNSETMLPMMHSYVSTAEDFNLYFFCGVPPIYVVAEPLPRDPGP